MSLREIEYNKVDGFSKLLIDYVSNSDHFNDLISDFPSIDNLSKQISLKSKNYDNKFFPPTIFTKNKSCKVT